MSTPSLIMRTQTAMRVVPAANAAIRSLALGSSESTSSGRSPVIRCTISAYARASSWSLASTSPAASGTPDSRRWVIRSSMAAMTCGTHWPRGSSAVRQASALGAARDRRPTARPR